MSKPKVLISDKMDPNAARIFEERGCDVDVKPGMTPDELKAVIGQYDGLAIRSATKVTPEIAAIRGIPVGEPSISPNRHVEVADYAELLDMFLGTHDPTQLNRQGNDVGTQYRSAIFPLDAKQQEEAEAAIGRWNAANGKMAVTTIEGLSDGEQSATWYPAEGYHQDYWEGEGQRNPYCQATIPPKLMKLRKSFQKYVKDDA